VHEEVYKAIYPDVALLSQSAFWGHELGDFAHIVIAGKKAPPTLHEH